MGMSGVAAHGLGRLLSDSRIRDGATLEKLKSSLLPDTNPAQK
jgi:hypothetical protein